MKTLLLFTCVFWPALSGAVNQVLACADGDSRVAVERGAPDFPDLSSDDALRQVLEKAFETDQGARRALTRAMGSGDPEKVRAAVKLMQQADRENREIVQRILDRHGWLPASRIGKTAADGLFFIVQHGPTTMIEEFLPQLQALARRGEARTTHAAMMEDRLLMYRGDKQIYGTQSCRGRIWPIADVANVNARREQAGFDLTVEQNARRLDAAFDPDEPLPDTPRCVVS